MSKTNLFWIESKDGDGDEQIVYHSKDDETGEMYYQFLSRASANKFLKEHKKHASEFVYRIARQVIQTFKTNWE